MHCGGCSTNFYPMYPSYGYPMATGGHTFPLIVVLFILLIIIGATCYVG